jgi:hypothetical protein
VLLSVSAFNLLTGMYMKQKTADLLALSDNDVSTLFSHFGNLSDYRCYQELKQEQAAFDAACRWPLLAELAGVDQPDNK